MTIPARPVIEPIRPAGILLKIMWNINGVDNPVAIAWINRPLIKMGKLGEVAHMMSPTTKAMAASKWMLCDLNFLSRKAVVAMTIVTINR